MNSARAFRAKVLRQLAPQLRTLPVADAHTLPDWQSLEQLPDWCALPLEDQHRLAACCGSLYLATTIRQCIDGRARRQVQDQLGPVLLSALLVVERCEFEPSVSFVDQLEPVDGQASVQAPAEPLAQRVMRAGVAVLLATVEDERWRALLIDRLEANIASSAGVLPAPLAEAILTRAWQLANRPVERSMKTAAVASA